MTYNVFGGTLNLAQSNPIGRVASLLRGSYEEVGHFQTISTCQDGLACR